MRRDSSASIESPTPERKPETSGFAEARSAKRRLLHDLAQSVEEGRSLQPEDLLVRWPTNPASDPDIASVLLFDREHRQLPEDPPESELEKRFPKQSESVSQLRERHQVLRSLGFAQSSLLDFSLALPKVGDEVFGFRLCRELGSGAFATVFLAEQGDLAGRPVVLKISDVSGDEPQMLAQLQHTNIVPIHSVHTDEAAGLRAVCMPYFGGACLNNIVEAAWAENAFPVRGADLTAAVAKVESPPIRTMQPQAEGSVAADSFIASEASSPRRLWEKMSYLQAAAWIAVRLAEGLEHAHQRGILHRDIKPSNILITSDGQPMLLDFNLAQRRHEEAAAALGGTVAYMAPEHLRAFNARSGTNIDHRADIYSLGMVLFEMFSGRSPFMRSGSYAPLAIMVEAMAVERSRRAPSLRDHRAGTPWALESILRKCLAPDSDRRYQRAGDLAEDLRRFLEDRPLRYAPELSYRERAAKWLRRHPRLTSSVGVAVVAACVLAGAGVAVSVLRDRLAVTQENLLDAQSRKDYQRFQEGAKQALLLVNANTDLPEHEKQGATVCEQTLAIFGVLDRDDWQSHPTWTRLEATERRHLAEDTRELLPMLAWARVKQAPKDRDTLRDALRLLEKAERITELPDSPALWHDRAYYLTALGEKEDAAKAAKRAREMRPATARDHCLLATAYLREGGAQAEARALAELNLAIAANPQHYWSWFQRGVCRMRMGDHQLAAADFGTCVGLWPDFAWSHFNLGCAHERAGHKDEARVCYDKAIALDPQFVDARLNRGLLYLEQKQFEKALTDFTEALADRTSNPTLLAGTALALEGLGRDQDAEAAFQKTFSKLQNAPPAIRNRIRCSYAFAVSRRPPTKAMQAFDAVLAANPKDAAALFGKAMIAASMGRHLEAIGFLDQTLVAAPEFHDARRHRAIQLAHSGRHREAFQAIADCLRREPETGAALYAAACVESLASAELPRARRAEAERKSLDLLAEAFAQGYGRDTAAQDPDLVVLHDNAEFLRLTSAASAKKQ